MWWAVSISHLHSGQVELWSHPRFASRSNDQTLFCTINQAKNLHLGEAQHFQMEAIVGFLVTPINCALYVDAAEYWPFCVSFHVIWSGCVVWRSTCVTKFHRVKYSWSKVRLKPKR